MSFPLFNTIKKHAYLRQIGQEKKKSLNAQAPSLTQKRSSPDQH